jgi:hypothetical protein
MLLPLTSNARAGTRMDDVTGVRRSTMAGTAARVLRRLVQLEERLAGSRLRAAPDAELSVLIDCIREEAACLAELYELATHGTCARCGAADVPLPAVLRIDAERGVCEDCHASPRVPTVAVAALCDDREVLTVTRGDVARLAGRAVTDDEAARVAAAVQGCALASALANAVGIVCGLPH